MLEKCHVCSYLSVFFKFIYQTNKSALCSLYSKYKLFSFTEKDISLRIHAGRSHSPTFIHWSHVDQSLPNKGHWLDYWDSCCIPTHLLRSLSSMHLVAVTSLPCRFPSIQVLSLKKQRHTLLIFKPESFPPPNLLSHR